MKGHGYLGDERAQERLRSQLKLRQLQHDEDLKVVLETPQGRRFVWMLLARTNLFGCSFVGNNDSTNHNEGVRSVGVWLMTEAQRVAPLDYVHMVREQLAASADEALHRRDAKEATAETDE